MASPPPLLLAALAAAAGALLLGLGAASSGGVGAAALCVVALALALCVAPAGRGARGARVVGLGLVFGLVSAARARGPPPDALARSVPDEGVRVEVEGVIASAEPPTVNGTAFVLAATGWSDGPLSVADTARVRGFAATDETHPPVEPLPGDRVRVVGRVAPIAAPTNPGAYDAREAWARDGVFVRLDAPDPRGIEFARRADGPLAGVAAARNAAARSFDAHYSARDAGVLRSLVLGDRGALDPQDRRRFQDAGAAHILAISGSHLALLLGGAALCLRYARVPRRTAAVAALCTAALLVPFTGGAAPVVRAAAGAALFLFGRLVSREPSSGVLLAGVALALAAFEPTLLRDPGARMSFAAATGLVLLATRLRRVLVRERPLAPGILGRPRAPVRSALAVGIAAWLASTPVVAGHLEQVSYAAVPVGLVAVPLSALAILFGGVACLLDAVDPLAAPLRALAALALEGLRAVLAVPPLVGLGTHACAPPSVAWHVAYAVAFLGCALGARRAARAGAIALVALLGVLAVPPTRVPPPHVRLTLLDVGHGQAALLETPDGRVALLDAGSRDRPDVARRVVLPALAERRVRHLDLAVASHADADHAGGLPEVLSRVPAAVVTIPFGFARSPPTGWAGLAPVPREVGDGETLLEGAWGRLVVLGPPDPPPARASRNDACLVVRLDTAHGTALLPGDREVAGVDALLLAHEDVACDVLVLPHHGHPGAGLDRLVAACAARLAIASTPPPTARRLARDVLATGTSGAVEVVFGPDGPSARTPWAGRADGGGAWDPRPPPSDMPDPLDLVLAGGALLALSLLAIRLRWLTRGGACTAALLGLASVATFGGPALATLFAPFLVATLAGRLPAPAGELAEGPRTARQVIANGAGAALGLALGWALDPAVGLVAFAGSLAALGADTLATEIGTRYGGVPRHALTGRRLATGESGGVTLAGTAASLVGAALAPATLLWLAGLRPGPAAGIAAAGVAAGLLDSVLGATLQRRGTCSTCGARTEAAVHCGVAVPTARGRLRFLDNDGVNVVNSLAGALLALALA